MQTNPLFGARAYLSGPIENDSTHYNWRTEPTKVLVERFGINLFDPFADPKQQWVPDLLKAREEKDYETIKKIAKSFVKKDLAMVDRADITIAYLPYGVPTTGTHHEIINSTNAKKPTLLVSNMNDIAYIPLWYYGFIPTEFMFPNWESLYNYLDSVNKREHKREHKSNDRWSFIYGDI
jgi:nucleoside 2-deoxyribosyltransferase